MKKLTSLLSIVLIGVLLLTACGSGGSNGAEKKGNGEVTIWATNINVPVLEQAAKEYQKDHKDFKVKVVEMANDDIRSKMVTGLQAGGKGLPDAALLVDDGLTGWLESFPNSFVNLSEKEGFTDITKDFPKYKIDSISKDGDVYAFPFDAGPVGVFYRKDIFEKAGVDPAAIKTWDDYIAAGKVIKEKTGTNMLSYDSNDSTVFTILLSQQGFGYYSKDGKTTIGTKESQNAANVFKQLADNKTLLGTPGWNAWVTSLSDSQTATAIAGGWLVGTIQQQLPDQKGKWGVMELPAFEPGGSQSANQGGSSFAISKNSPNVDEAYDFLKFFSTDFKMQELAMDGGLFPSYLPVYESDLFSKPLEYFNNEPVWTFFANQMEKIPSVFYTTNDNLARDEIIKVQSEITTGKDVKKSLDDASERLKNREK
ncbi:ABC transporter substrate-binding protein [Neobacillus muris]|uniref:ABC transporter substrate-binding protein n=1 Tax=Neobacillus muris TaxID=2941334 RepID=UPI00203F9194|nr:sugar ABC transporter substrate-binding protein [Neobacillus muris]